MSAKKIYDLAVKTGSYEKNGETRGRYQNIGSVLQMEDGGKMILLDRSFNPAGVPFKEGSDQIVVSMFDPKDDGAAKTDKPAASTQGTGQTRSGPGGDIPF